MNTTFQASMQTKNTTKRQAKTPAFNKSGAQASKQMDASVNPFAMTKTATPFKLSVTGTEFIPSAEMTKFQMVLNATFTPSTSSGYNSEESTTVVKDSKVSEKVTEDKYKTEMCKNWIENNECRYGKKCQFAHGKEELAAYKSSTEDKRRTKNCRVFYKEKQCMYGSRCMFRHEHRHYNQIMRHYYAAQLYTMESLFSNAKDQAQFVNSMESDVHKLPVFAQIHEQYVEEEEEPIDSESDFDANESELSFIEMEEDIHAYCDPDVKSPTECEAESALNVSHSTFVSSQDGSVSTEVAHKHEMDSEAGAKTSCFDIATQMHHLLEGGEDLSF